MICDLCSKITWSLDIFSELFLPLPYRGILLYCDKKKNKKISSSSLAKRNSFMLFPAKYLHSNCFWTSIEKWDLFEEQNPKCITNF